METSGSQRYSRPGEDHAIEVAESVVGLGYCVLPGAKTEKLDSRRRAWTSEACRAFSASDRLCTPTRVSKFLRWCSGSFAGGRPIISFEERQPALFACDTYHLRLHRRNDRHFVLVIDFSSDLENLCAH